MNRGLVFALAAATLGAAVLIFATASMLPDPVATHFAMGGRANGWMTRTGYVAFTLGFCVAVPWIVFAITALVGPRYSFKELARASAEADAEKRRAMRTFGAVLGILIALLAGAVHLLLIDANAKSPATLDERWFFVVMGAFVAVLLVLIVANWRRLAR